jgi:iron complex outermembrane recepter protein
MKKTLLIMVLGLVSFVSVAQYGSISGKIVDDISGEEMIGVNVVINGTVKGAITDLDGIFRIANVAPGKQELRITFVGYTTLMREVTVVANQETDMGVISMSMNVIGLREVEVFASVSDDRATPVAVSTIKAEQIEERFFSVELPDMVNSMPGVFATQGAGGFGDQEIYVRGFDQSNVAFLLNGVPVNDMENGRMFWSNFAGLNEVTRRMEVQRGLGASKLAVSSLGGTVNMITKPNEARKGGTFIHTVSNGSFNNRTQLSLHSGENKKGLSVSFQGSRFSTNSSLIGLPANQQGGYIPGAFVDAWSYYLGIHKKIDNSHSLMFSAFGAPVNRGTAFTTTDDVYERAGTVYFNQATGWYRGEFFNGRQNFAHKPQISLTHFWNIDKNTTLSTAAYVSVARVYSTQFRKVEGTGLQYLTDARDLYVDFDAMYNYNVGMLGVGASPSGMHGLITVNNPGGDLDAPPIVGLASQYFLEARHNDHMWYGLISTYNKRLDNWNITAGVDLRDYTAGHYATLFETFGGDFVMDVDRRTLVDNNKLRPNNVIRPGERFNYDYDGHVRWGSLFGQAEYSMGKLDLFTTLSASAIQMWRVGNMWNGNFPNNSLGKSEVKTFYNYNVKAGGNYRITGRNSLFMNLGHFTRAPFLTNAFQIARYNDAFIEGLKNETVYAAELGYRYISSKLGFNLNAYYTSWQDRALRASVFADGVEYIFGTSDQDAVHMGIEGDFRWTVTPALEVTGFVSVGDWRWKGNTNTVITNSIDQSVSNLTIFVDNLPVGNAAQTTVGSGVHYTGFRDMYIGARFNYFDRLWVRFFPEDYQTAGRPGPERLPSYYIIDLYFGRYFKINDTRARFAANINNLTNEHFVRWASDFQGNTQKAYGWGRNYNLGLTIYF